MKEKEKVENREREKRVIEREKGCVSERKIMGDKDKEKERKKTKKREKQTKRDGERERVCVSEKERKGVRM